MTQNQISVDMALAERRIAEAAALADIETAGIQLHAMGRRVWDVRAMTDMREHCAFSVDMAVQALAYAEWRGLVGVIERQGCGLPAVVRVLRDPA
jgi:hypothetical protein